jgi:hypothetical protein
MRLAKHNKIVANFGTVICNRTGDNIEYLKVRF